jgi:cell division septum initiation protein DivIVA
MLQELEALETKLTQLLETHRALREENVRLRQQLVALENSNKLLSGRLDAARSRVENLFEQLPD